MRVKVVIGMYMKGETEFWRVLLEENAEFFSSHLG